MISRRTLLGTSLAAATPLSHAAFAPDYPADPSRSSSPANAGGPSDVGARSSHRSWRGHRPVRPCREQARRRCPAWPDGPRRAKPDGYTLGVVHMPGTNTIILDFDRKAAFNTDSFILVCNQVLDPGVIWVKVDCLQDPCGSGERRQTESREAVRLHDRHPER